MKTITQKVDIPQVKLNLLNKWLQHGKLVEAAGDNELLYKATFDFGGGFTAEITVVNSYSGPYLDAVIFLQGVKVMYLTPSLDQLEGEYVFRLDEGKFIAVINGTNKS